MGTPAGRGIGVLGQGGTEEHVAVASGGQHHGMTGGGADLPGHQVAGDDAPSAAVGDDHVEHLGAGVQPHGALLHLTLQRLAGRDLELLAGLAPAVVGPRHLHATEGSGGQAAAVFAGERRAHRVHVVDDPHRLCASR